MMSIYNLFVWILLFIFVSLTTQIQGQYDDTRCKCVCPDPSLILNSTSTSKRILYITNKVPRDKCNCDAVVLPNVMDLKEKAAEFCPRCDCKYENRSTTIIKVVVIIVIWIVSLLMIYMLFLMCLEPLLNKRIKNTAYQEHENEEDDEVGEGSSRGGDRTAHRMTSTGLGSSTSSSAVPAEGPSVFNRVGQISKWKRQVEQQRRNIYDRHTMLN